MPRWASVIAVAGVTFTGCRGIILDGEVFSSTYAGSVTWANSAKANAQIVNKGVKGNRFGLQMDSAESSKLVTMLAAMQTAESGAGTFLVNLVDEFVTINHYCLKDYSLGDKWFQKGQTSEGWTENVILRFISKVAA